jgi:predicted RNA binding protein YcfA (HicA-like mRNA interferase family)
MVKLEKLIAKTLQNRAISYNEAERILKNLGFDVIAYGSHHVFRKKGTIKMFLSRKEQSFSPIKLERSKRC